MKHFKAAVASNRPLAEGTWEMEFGWDGGERPEPGQFVTVLARGATDPLLRRPVAFSRFDAPSSRASFIYLKRGASTTILSSLAPGAPLDVIGPLGRGFPPPPEGGRAILVAGGIGLGPVLFLADSLRERKADFAFVYGARSAGLVPRERLPRDAAIMTDDGSAGGKGTAADALRSLLAEGGASRIYACGPGKMLEAAARIAEEAGIPCSASMEQHMACGVGACMGCAVKLRKGGYARACAEGPVFEAADIAWED